MRFWDSSAVIPLLVGEKATGVILDLVASDRQMHVWWGTEIECVSTLARLEREGIDASIIEGALARLAALREDWSEIAPGSAVREVAKRFLRVHALRAADSLQLAAAWILADGQPDSVTLVSLDDRLRTAARREGLPVLP
ncbi:MAG TPA: type II toxin-antitoxin system VapC family toxin [Thermoanaerobaculia bacterium]|nr:type II toxin-antitoxin system VapC family toxin [Thermoanaerobaculia bacterium]